MQKYVTGTAWANDVNWLAKYGHNCWDTICDVMPLNQWFTTGELTWRNGPAAQVQREVRLVLNNVIAEYKALGLIDCPVVRDGNRYLLV